MEIAVGWMIPRTAVSSGTVLSYSVLLDMLGAICVFMPVYLVVRTAMNVGMTVLISVEMLMFRAVGVGTDAIDLVPVAEPVTVLMTVLDMPDHVKAMALPMRMIYTSVGNRACWMLC
jgi:hypothetical protein